MWGTEMAQLLKALLCKHVELSLIPEIHLYLETKSCYMVQICHFRSVNHYPWLKDLPLILLHQEILTFKDEPFHEWSDPVTSYFLLP